VSDLRLHLDADTSSKALYKALLDLEYDVTRTPNDWMPHDASDERQLLGATAHGRSIFTFNIRDFVSLAKKYHQHRGIILAAQSNWSLSELIEALDCLFSKKKAEDLRGQVYWLNQSRHGKL
jgi:hypothetical protein